MTFRADRLGAGRPGGGGSTPGEIDYRLARHRLLSEYRKGRLARHELCDAHPELMRAARNIGEPTDQRCPVCEESDGRAGLVRVRATHACAGQVRDDEGGDDQAPPGCGELACYVVEVCPACSWNHLARVFLVQPIKPRKARSTPSA
jgi:hypothetical protein